jgi:hypothetical protein
VLVQTNPGAVEHIIDAMTDLERVEFVNAVTGPYGAILAVNGTADDIERVRRRIAEIDHVTRTLTCPTRSAWT